MDDPSLVCGLESAGDLLRDLKDLENRDRPLLEPIGQCQSFDELQYKRMDPVGFFQAVDSADVGMIHGSQEPSFALEACQPPSVSCEGRGKNLDGHLAAEFRIE